MVAPHNAQMELHDFHVNDVTYDNVCECVLLWVCGKGIAKGSEKNGIRSIEFYESRVCVCVCTFCFVIFSAAYFVCEWIVRWHFGLSPMSDEYVLRII